MMRATIGDRARAGFFAAAVVTFLSAGMSCEVVPAGFEEFSGATRSERPNLLRKQTPEQQINLYSETMLRIHPPDIELADVVAELGGLGAVLVKERMMASDSDVEKADLSLVLVRMQKLGGHTMSARIPN